VYDTCKDVGRIYPLSFTHVESKRLYSSPMLACITVKPAYEFEEQSHAVYNSQGGYIDDVESRG